MRRSKRPSDWIAYAGLDRAPQGETLAYYDGFLPCARSLPIVALFTRRLVAETAKRSQVWARRYNLRNR